MSTDYPVLKLRLTSVDYLGLVALVCNAPQATLASRNPGVGDLGDQSARTLEYRGYAKTSHATADGIWFLPTARGQRLVMELEGYLHG